LEAQPVQVRAAWLTEKAWEPFGWLPRADTDPRDGSQRLAFDWADAHVNLIGHSLDEVATVDGGLRCDVLYRHDTHTQVLMPLNGDAVVAVAPSRVDFSSPGDAGEVRAFLLRRQEAIVLFQGTWHWGPYPVGHERITLFNVQGLRYAEDNRDADLAGKGLSVEVLIPE
jgi:ureidoglycolate hydrolase